ncbi:MAG: PKD domain-containing protein [Candidatus Margulisiibacteriota bacterium]
MSDILDYIGSIFSTPSPSVSACVAPADSCLARNGLPTYPTYINPSPADVYLSAFAEGVTLTWTPESQPAIINADDSFAGMKLICKFSTGNVEAVPDENGNLAISHTLSAPLSSPVMCDLVYEDCDGNSKTLRDAVTLYGPRVIDDSQTNLDQCYYNPSPIIVPGYSLDVENLAAEHEEIYEGDTVRLSFPVAGITECDGSADELAVAIIVDGAEYAPAIDGDRYYADVTLADNLPGVPYKAAVRVIDNNPLHSGSQAVYSDEISIYVQSAGSSTDLPSATISSNLAYSYHAGETATDITCYSDDPDATFAWSVTRPGPDEDEAVVQYFDGATIASYTFDLEGDYDFHCEVTAGDGVTQNHEIRSVGVYPAETVIPAASIIAPFSGSTGETITFIAGDADEGTYAYVWNFGDGNSAAGSLVDYAYTDSGTYTVGLTVSRLDDPEVYNTVTQQVTIAPPAVTPPILSLIAPYAAHVGEAVELNIASADTANWDYAFNFGDGTAIAAGISASHAYAEQGTYTIQLTATSTADAALQYNVTQSISIVPVEIELPALSCVVPYSAQVGSTIMMSVASPDEANWGYSWQFGDGEAVSGTSVTHAYADQGTYTVRLTAVSLADPSISTYISQAIAIVPISVALPALSLLAPYAAEEDTSVAFSVVSPDTAHWTYTFQLGDGSAAQTATMVNHTYAAAGKYTVLLTAAYNDDPTISSTISHIMTIVPHGDPVPSLELSPGMGAAPLTVTADATDSYATAAGAAITNYLFNWGDGSAEESSATGVLSHLFSCSGSSCAYTVRVTVTDSYGGIANITATVSTWQP